jgi:hypothetical protein
MNPNTRTVLTSRSLDLANIYDLAAKIIYTVGFDLAIESSTPNQEAIKFYKTLQEMITTYNSRYSQKLHIAQLIPKELQP